MISAFIGGIVMIEDEDGYKLSKGEVLRLGKLYLEQTRNGMGDAFSLISEIIRLVEKGCFTFSDIGVDPEELMSLFKNVKEKREEDWKRSIADLNEKYEDTQVRLQRLSEN